MDKLDEFLYKYQYFLYKFASYIMVNVWEPRIRVIKRARKLIDFMCDFLHLLCGDCRPICTLSFRRARIFITVWNAHLIDIGHKWSTKTDTADNILPYKRIENVTEL